MDFRKLVAYGFVAALAFLPLGGSRDMAMACGTVTYYTFANGSCAGTWQTATVLWSVVEHEINTGVADSFIMSDQPGTCVT